MNNSVTEKLTWTEISNGLRVHFLQEDILRRPKESFAARIGTAFNKPGNTFLPCLGLVGHFWFLVWLDTHYQLGWGLDVSGLTPLTGWKCFLATLLVLVVGTVLVEFITGVWDAIADFSEATHELKRDEAHAANAARLVITRLTTDPQFRDRYPTEDEYEQLRTFAGVRRGSTARSVYGRRPPPPRPIPDRGASAMMPDIAPRYLTVREYNDKFIEHTRLALGLDLPSAEELRGAQTPPSNNPHLVTKAMVGLPARPMSGAAALRPEINIGGLE